MGTAFHKSMPYHTKGFLGGTSRLDGFQSVI